MAASNGSSLEWQSYSPEAAIADPVDTGGLTRVTDNSGGTVSATEIVAVVSVATAANAIATLANLVDILITQWDGEAGVGTGGARDSVIALLNAARANKHIKS